MTTTPKQQEALAECAHALATNFDMRARDIIATHAAQAGVSVKAFERLRDQARTEAQYDAA